MNMQNFDSEKYRKILTKHAHIRLRQHLDKPSQLAPVIHRNKH